MAGVTPRDTLTDHHCRVGDESTWNGPVHLGLSHLFLQKSLTTTQSLGFRSCSGPVAGVGRASFSYLWTEFRAEDRVAQYLNITSSQREASGKIGFTDPIPMCEGHPNSISKGLSPYFGFSLMRICIKAMGSIFVRPKPAQSNTYLVCFFNVPFSLSNAPHLLQAG